MITAVLAGSLTLDAVSLAVTAYTLGAAAKRSADVSTRSTVRRVAGLLGIGSALACIGAINVILAPDIGQAGTHLPQTVSLAIAVVLLITPLGGMALVWLMYRAGPRHQ